jgi:hypothetical protein
MNSSTYAVQTCHYRLFTLIKRLSIKQQYTAAKELNNQTRHHAPRHCCPLAAYSRIAPKGMTADLHYAII